MNRNKRKFAIALQLCPIVLLPLLAASSALAQTSATAPSTEAEAPQVSYIRNIIPPPVPEKLQVQAGFIAFLEGHGVGTQNYVCKPSGTGFAFVLFTPQATLFADNDQQLTTHFFSPNPFEANTDPNVVTDRQIRVTWQDSQDSSTIWAKLDQASTDPNFVAPGAVAWLLLDVVGAQEGPTGGKTLTAAKFVQRLNTSGGLAPATGCSSAADAGKEAFVPYTADYFFYKKAEN